MKIRPELSLLLLASTVLACAGDDSSTTNGFQDTLPTGDGDPDGETGDGDGDPTAGDGDGDPTGDGDGDPTGDGDGDPTGDGDGDGDPPVDACAFASSPADWSLPQNFVGPDVYEDLTDSHGCAVGGEYRYQLLDMTGDGAVDFLVTDSCGLDGVGYDNWHVFKNTGSGFAAAPISWSLPEFLIGDQQFYQNINDDWNCDGGRFRYQVVEMTGDGAVDLLVTNACDDGGVGVTSWWVHENTGNGFAEQPIEWSLPQYLVGDNEFYELTSDSWPCNGGQFRYQLLDMTGDGAVDFLITDACDALGVGATQWLVHENTGNGFDGQPIEWDLPQVFGTEEEIYEQIADYWPCTQGEYRYQLLDITGDGAIDFLITDACDATGVGATEWHVLENTGTGFAGAPMIWSLPNPFGGAEIYEQLADDVPCDQGGLLKYQTLDMTGDGAPDLVLTEGCDPTGIGTDYWNVFKNTGDGFDGQPIVWPLPTPIAGDDLHEELSDEWGCSAGGTYSYSVFDLNGDAAPDLVATDLCDVEGVGTTEWSLYAAVCE